MAGNTQGVRSGQKFFSPFPFGSMNLDDAPLAIQDSEFLWSENFLRLGNGNLRTAWDIGTPLLTAPGGKTIVSFFFYTLGANYFSAVFFSDGSAMQVNTMTGVQVQIGPPGTFFNSTNGQLPACAQWGTLYLLISNRNTTNDYWAWDGAILYTAGTAAPNGVNILSGGSQYTSNPTVTAFGGNGTGLVVVPTVSNGSVINLEITNPGTGYQVGDVVQLSFTGGGSDTSAELTANIDAGAVTAVGISSMGSG